MNIFFHPDDVPDDVSTLKDMVQQPDGSSMSQDDRMDFMSALSISVRFQKAFGSTKLLDGLRDLYPQAVEARLPEATIRAKRGLDVDYDGDDSFDDDDDEDLFL